MGWRDKEAGLPVERDTLFRIASMSKPVTAAAAMMALEERGLALDEPITPWAPEFADMRVLRAPDGPLDQTDPAARPITFDDLLTHRSGYCDPWTALSTSDPSTILQRVRHQKPDYGFRTTFCYNNIQYDAAGRFIPAITHQDWHDYVAAHLLRPLGMDHTVTTEAALEKSTDAARPHGTVDGRPARRLML